MMNFAAVPFLRQLMDLRKNNLRSRS
jgi:hypothetical protein